MPNPALTHTQHKNKKIYTNFRILNVECENDSCLDLILCLSHFQQTEIMVDFWLACALIDLTILIRILKNGIKQRHQHVLVLILNVPRSISFFFSLCCRSCELNIYGYFDWDRCSWNHPRRNTAAIFISFFPFNFFSDEHN